MRRVQEELEQLRPKELLYGSAAPLFERAETTGKDQASFARAHNRGRLSPHNPTPRAVRESLAPRLRWMTGSLLRIMRFRCSRIILECCR